MKESYILCILLLVIVLIHGLSLESPLTWCHGIFACLSFLWPLIILTFPSESPLALHLEAMVFSRLHFWQAGIILTNLSSPSPFILNTLYSACQYFWWPEKSTLSSGSLWPETLKYIPLYSGCLHFLLILIILYCVRAFWLLTSMPHWIPLSAVSDLILTLSPESPLALHFDATVFSFSTFLAASDSLAPLSAIYSAVAAPTPVLAPEYR